MIVRHQRASASNRGFRQLARYIQGRSDKPRATWFLAANLPGVTRSDDLELACRLVEAVHAQNTRAGRDRTYHLVISLHPEDRSLDRNELRRVVENLVETLGFADHQYIAARHNGQRTTKPTMGSTASPAGPGRSSVPRFKPGSYEAGTTCMKCAPALASCFGPMTTGSSSRTLSGASV